MIQGKNEGRRREGRGKGGEAEEEHLEKKQPDSPAVCKLIAHPPVTWQKRGRAKKKKGRKKNNLNKHTQKEKRRKHDVSW